MGIRMKNKGPVEHQVINESIIEAILSESKLEKAVKPPTNQRLRSKHYESMYLQPIQVIKEWLTPDQYVGFCLGNALKYIGRFNIESFGKGGVQDIEKAIDYFEWLVDSQTGTKKVDGVQDIDPQTDTKKVDGVQDILKAIKKTIDHLERLVDSQTKI